MLPPAQHFLSVLSMGTQVQAVRGTQRLSRTSDFQETSQENLTLWNETYSLPQNLLWLPIAPMASILFLLPLT